MEEEHVANIEEKQIIKEQVGNKLGTWRRNDREGKCRKHGGETSKEHEGGTRKGQWNKEEYEEYENIGRPEQKTLCDEITRIFSDIPKVFNKHTKSSQVYP